MAPLINKIVASRDDLDDRRQEKYAKQNALKSFEGITERFNRIDKDFSLLQTRVFIFPTYPPQE